jgi:hypothetical protein
VTGAEERAEQGHPERSADACHRPRIAGMVMENEPTVPVGTRKPGLRLPSAGQTGDQSRCRIGDE